MLKSILRPARLVPSSCASAPRNTREAGISSSTNVDILIIQYLSWSFYGVSYCKGVPFWMTFVTVVVT